MTGDDSARALKQSGAQDDWKPRCHHYSFAHVVFRDFAFAHPLETMASLATPEDCSRFIQHLFRVVSEHCDARGAVADFGPHDIKVHRGRVHDYPCAVVEMPPPARTTEAFYVGLVLLTDVAAQDPRPDRLRYFTLEKGAGEFFGSSTVLCEWTSTLHSAYGGGPAPVLRDFVEAVATKCRREA